MLAHKFWKDLPQMVSENNEASIKVSFKIEKGEIIPEMRKESSKPSSKSKLRATDLQENMEEANRDSIDDQINDNLEFGLPRTNSQISD
jgi:hypothetical protein